LYSELDALRAIKKEAEKQLIAQSHTLHLGGAPDLSRHGNTPTDIQVLETSQGVALGFQVDEATLSAGYPLVDNETLDLNFAIDATVDADLFSEQRSELHNSPGPLATLQPGRNEFTVYEYPPLYLRALCFTGCEDFNDCTVDACNPAVGCQHTAVPNGTPCGGGFGTCQDGNCYATFPCTEQGIRDAIALGGGPHTFQCDDPTTVVTQAEIVLDNDVVLGGSGRLTVDGNGNHRVFSVAEGVNAELIGVTVTGGATTEVGGGIQNAGTFLLRDSTVSGNTASVGGGVANLETGTLIIVNSILAQNMATTFGGGIRNQGGAEVIDTSVLNNAAMQAAGGISNRPGATMTLTGATVQGNIATGPRGGIANTGTMTLNETTVSGNQAGDVGGGISNRLDGTLTLTNTTVYGNTATHGGGILNQDAGTLTSINSTVSGNSSTNGRGGGVVNEATMTFGQHHDRGELCHRDRNGNFESGTGHPAKHHRSGRLLVHDTAHLARWQHRKRGRHVHARAPNRPSVSPRSAAVPRAVTKQRRGDPDACALVRQPCHQPDSRGGLRRDHRPARPATPGDWW
jgi:hypothetical protein